MGAGKKEFRRTVWFWSIVVLAGLVAVGAAQPLVASAALGGTARAPEEVESLVVEATAKTPRPAEFDSAETVRDPATGPSSEATTAPVVEAEPTPAPVETLAPVALGASLDEGADAVQSDPTCIGDCVLGLTQLATEASALEAEPVAAGPDYEQRGHVALGRISYPWQSLGFAVTFHPPRDGFRGLTFPDEKRIEIYVDPSMSDAFLLHVIAHEIGHAVDLVHNSVADEQVWLTARGLEPMTWWAGAYGNDFASPAGDFAECFAAWAVGSSSRSELAGSCEGTASVMAQLASS